MRMVVVVVVTVTVGHTHHAMPHTHTRRWGAAAVLYVVAHNCTHTDTRAPTVSHATLLWAAVSLRKGIGRE
jgi:type 1 glutamine amidotransferase